MAINTPYGQNNPITTYQHWHINSDFTGSAEPISNWSICDDSSEGIGTGLTHSSGIFTFPSTGKWFIQWNYNCYIAGVDQSYAGMYFYLTTNAGSSYNHTAHTYTANGYGYSAGASFYFLDVTNISNIKFKFVIHASGGSNTTTQSKTNGSSTGFIVQRVGDT